MADEPMRRMMGGAARHASERYQVDVVMQARALPRSFLDLIACLHVKS